MFCPRLQEIPASLLQQVVGRSVLVKSVFSLWGICEENAVFKTPESSPDAASCSALVQKLIRLPPHLIDDYKKEGVQFRMTVETVGR